MKDRFKVYEACNGFYIEDLITERVAACGDGVGLILGTEDNPLTCGMPGFEESWTEEVNEDPETFEAYFPNLHNLEIYDCPEFMDRYTVVLKKASPLEKRIWGVPNLHIGLGLSHNPDSPQGVSMWSYMDPEFVAEKGEMIWFLDLPERVQRHLAKRLEDD